MTGDFTSLFKAFTTTPIFDSCADKGDVGDGYCDDNSNNADCEFDGGDCCLDTVITDYCTECICHAPAYPETAQEKFFEFLDAFDGPFHIIEQSIIGDVKATYKKIKPFIKWMYVNIENQSGPDEDYEWSTYG